MPDLLLALFAGMLTIAALYAAGATDPARCVD
jgi:hypothetical protein